MRRIVLLGVTAVLLAGAGLALWRDAGSAGDEAHEVASGLRCLTCAGETVADSASPVAAAMRDVIADQLAAGRDPDQIRDWFAQRYGPRILAEPPMSGVGALLWALPCAALLAGLLLAARTLRRRRPRRLADDTVPAARPARVATRIWYATALTLVALVAVIAAAGRATTTTTTSPAAAAEPTTPQPADLAAEGLALAQALEQQGDYAAAADAYRDVAREHPDPRVDRRLAFALLRSGQPAEAADVARRVLADQPNDAEALLLLGLAQRALHSPDAQATLREFLRVAPDHPAAAEVRTLISPP